MKTNVDGYELKAVKFQGYTQNETMHPGGYGLFVRADETETTLAGVIYDTNRCRESARELLVPNTAIEKQVKGPEYFDELLTPIDRMHILTERYIGALQ